jgi:extradiol dioxygenase family protein
MGVPKPFHIETEETTLKESSQFVSPSNSKGLNKSRQNYIKIQQTSNTRSKEKQVNFDIFGDDDASENYSEFDDNNFESQKSLEKIKDSFR